MKENGMNLRSRTIVIHCQQHDKVRHSKLKHMDKGADKLSLKENKTIDFATFRSISKDRTHDRQCGLAFLIIRLRGSWAGLTGTGSPGINTAQVSIILSLQTTQEFERND